MDVQSVISYKMTCRHACRWRWWRHLFSNTYVCPACDKSYLRIHGLILYSVAPKVVLLDPPWLIKTYSRPLLYIHMWVSGQIIFLPIQLFFQICVVINDVMNVTCKNYIEIGLLFLIISCHKTRTDNLLMLKWERNSCNLAHNESSRFLSRFLSQLTIKITSWLCRYLVLHVEPRIAFF